MSETVETAATALGPDFEESLRKLFIHIAENHCDHEFSGWREFENGGEQFCQKCGLGAMAHSMRYLP